jgi:hypothetical protein
VRVSPSLGGAVPQGTAPLYLRTGAAAHPRATPPGRLSEDAFFALDVSWPLQLLPRLTSPALLTLSGAGSSSSGGSSSSQRRGAAVVSFFGVADGVGSWRGVGVDPRLFSRRLMAAAAEHVLHAAADAAAAAEAAAEVASAAAAGDGGDAGGGGDLEESLPPLPPPSPAEVLEAAWRAVTRDEVVGSATVSLVSLDSFHRACMRCAGVRACV